MSDIPPRAPRTLFEPPGIAFTRLPRKTLTLWRLTLTLWTSLIVLLLGIVPTSLAQFLRADLTEWPLWTLVAAFVGCATVRGYRLAAVWQATGYALTADELLFRGGLLHQKLTAMPYGRIQTVEVSSGPLQRRLGLATVRARTGSYHSAAVKGLDTAEAENIRDRLTHLAGQKQVSL